MSHEDPVTIVITVAVSLLAVIIGVQNLSWFVQFVSQQAPIIRQR